MRTEELTTIDPVCRERCPQCREFLVPSEDPHAPESLRCANEECIVGDRPSSWSPDLE